MKKRGEDGLLLIGQKHFGKLTLLRFAPIEAMSGKT